MRRGVTLVEILVGVAVLVLGMIPVLRLFGQNRRTLGGSRSQILLQAEALRQIERTRRDVRAGLHAGVDPDEGHEQEVTGESLEGVRTLTRRDDGSFLVRVRLHDAERFFELSVPLADPWGGAR